MGNQQDPAQKVAPTVKPPKATADKSLLFGFNKVLLVSNVGFLLLVLAGTIVVVMRGSPEKAAASTPLEVTAARSLPANQLLQERDLAIDTRKAAAAATEEIAHRLEDEATTRRAKLVGRYLLLPVMKGGTIDTKRTATRPELSLEGGAISLGLAVDRKAVTDGEINAGTETLACSGRSQLGSQSFVVRAVQCPAAGDCTATLVLSPEQRADGMLFGPGLAPRLVTKSCSPDS